MADRVWRQVLRIIRIFRVARVFKMSKNLKGMFILARTRLYKSASALASRWDLKGHGLSEGSDLLGLSSRVRRAAPSLQP